MRETGDDEEIGYGRPPRATRFRKGQSGNPRGRPRGRRTEPPYEAVLGQMVTIREGGVERRVTAAEAFLLHMTRRALEGDAAASRIARPAIENARLVRTELAGPEHVVINLSFPRPGGVNSALVPLRMARKLDRYHDTARMALEPWIVDAVLARLGECRLTPEEQQTVVKATRTPKKVRWPDWWEVRPWEK
ncbi:MAG: DUF5681 domain-containing protein [Alphaproteobacteria bacterium]|nr:DUF5681 domain-containing protein [Alphaproteobacteria bacterium]MDX5368478.1 DUF5681 domain-containing protein [Alphaproteobacteria bacterium]